MAENRNQNPGSSGQQNNVGGGIGGRTGPQFGGPSSSRNDAPQSAPMNREPLSQNPGKESERRPIQQNWTDGSGKL